MGWPEARTHVQAGRPRVTDACLRGFICRNVLAVARLPDDEELLGDQIPELALVDCRPMLQGWHLLFVYSQRVSHAALEHQLSYFLPAGHQVLIEGAQLMGTDFTIAAGQVLCAQFVRNPAEAGTESDESESGSPDAPASEASRTESVGQDTTTAPADSEGEHLFDDDPRFCQHISRSRSRSPRTEPAAQDIPHARRGTERSRSRSPSAALACVAAASGVPGAAANVFVCEEALSPACIPWQFWCWGLLFGAIASLLILKWLAEPISHRPSEQFALASLRLLARRAGQHWRYVPGFTAIDFQAESGSESSGVIDALARDLPFVVVTPGYPITHATVRQVLPAAQAEVIQQVQDIRGTFFQSFFPRIIPADPQTVDGLGVLVADVGWTATDCVLCVDATRLDRRLFAIRAPEYVCRDELLSLANVRGNLGIEIFFGGDTQPLTEHGVHHVRTGLTIVLAPADSPPPPPTTLGQNLLSHTAWDSQDVVPSETAGHAYCLATAHGPVLLVCNPRSSPALEQQIAECLVQEVVPVAHFSASPRVVDATCDGLLCRTVIAVCRPPPSPCTHWFGVLIDARALLQGWRSAIALGSRIQCSVILEPFQTSCPVGWHLRLQDVPDAQDWVAVHPGQVLRVVPIPHVTMIARDRAPGASGAPSGPPVPTPAGTGQAAPVAPAHYTSTATRAGGGDGPCAAGRADRGHHTDAAATGGAQQSAFSDGTYVIVGQDYSPELVHVRLPTDIPVLEALRHINAAREPGARLCSPRLFAAHPQSVQGVGVLVAAPAWEPTGALVLLDSARVNGALFVLQLPNLLHRQAILEAAHLGSGPELEVYIKDLPWPLPPGARVDVTHGDVIVLVPVVYGLFTTLSFPDLLSAAEGWDPDWAPNQPYGDHAWVLAEGDRFVFQVVPGRRELVRADIARRLAFPHLELILRPARPAITNHACCGVMTRNTLAAVRTSHGVHYGAPRHPICFLDSRPLLLGITWRLAPDGLLARSRIQDPIQHRCPPGFVLGWFRPQTRPRPLDADLRVQDGDVIILAFIPAEIFAPDPAPDDHGGVPPGPSGHDSPERRAASQINVPHDGAAATPGITEGSAPAGSADIGGHERSGTAHRLPLSLSFPVHDISGSRVAMWTRAFLWFTPVLLYGFWGLDRTRVRTAPCTAGRRWWPRPEKSHGRVFLPGLLARFLLSGLCLASLPGGTVAAPTAGPSATEIVASAGRPGPSGASLETHQPPQAHLPRPLPTPCRNAAARELYRPLTGAGVGIKPYQDQTLQCPVIETPGYVTLLEEAIKAPGSRAYFLASTLLEALFEWEQERGVNHGVAPTTVLGNRVQLSLQHAVPLTHFQASALALSGIVPDNAAAGTVDWLDADISFLLRDRCVPPHKRDMFAAVRSWATGPAEASPVRLLVYSDGSAPSGRSLECAPGAWAISVWVETASQTYLLGHAAGLNQSLESAQRIGEIDDAALTCELLGVSWGLVWVIEHAAPFTVPVISLYDCLAAGRGTFGENKVAVSHHSGSHELALFATYLRQLAACRVDLSHDHVAGHAGDVGNELCDELAKHCRRQLPSSDQSILPTWPSTLFQHPLKAWSWMLGVPSPDLPTLFALEAEAYRLQRSPSLPRKDPVLGFTAHPSSNVPVEVRAVVMTFNVLSLYDPKGPGCVVAGQGMRVVAKRDVIKRQLSSLEFYCAAFKRPAWPVPRSCQTSTSLCCIRPQSPTAITV